MEKSKLKFDKFVIIGFVILDTSMRLMSDLYCNVTKNIYPKRYQLIFVYIDIDFIMYYIQTANMYRYFIRT